MSLFFEAVALLSGQGVAVIPTRHDSPAVPLVKRPAAFGVPASRTLAANPKFNHANAAIWTGAHSKLTIVDIDSTDPNHAAEAIAAFGDTPLKVRTPSGGLHLYFRYTGERRRIRPFGRSLPLDVLGGGLAAIPPSLRQAAGKKLAGAYSVIEGDLKCLAGLPALRKGAIAERIPASKKVTETFDAGAMREGDGRDNALFAFARAAAQGCCTLDALHTAVLLENGRFAEPLPNFIALAKAAQVWRYKMAGKLMSSGARAALMDMGAIAACTSHPAAFLMLAYLRSQHSHDHVFAIVPEAICVPLGMGHNTARRARDFLLAADLLELIEIGGRSRDGRRPNLYRLKPSPQNGRE
jgi:hypothetical protein